MVACEPDSTIINNRFIDNSDVGLIAPTSIVDRGDEVTPTGTHLSDGCQFWSAITP